MVRLLVVLELKDLQRRQHIPRADAVDPNVRMRPLNRETRREMSDGRLRRIVGRLGLWHIDNRPAHTPYHYHTPWRFPFH